MSEEKKRKIRENFATQAAKLSCVARTVPPVLFLSASQEEDRETADFCPLSADAGRMAVFAMTFCNPLTLKSATVIEGALS